jgi:hypothetical protein
MVEARVRGSIQYYPGTIKAHNNDGTYCVYFDDGARDIAVPLHNIRAAGAGLHVRDDMSTAASKLVGRVILPLANIFRRESAAGLIGGLIGSKTRFDEEDQWYAVWPPAPECRGGASEQKFEAAIPNNPDTGMERPSPSKEPIFWIKVGFELDLHESALGAHLLHRPFQLPGVGEEEYHNAELQGSIQRVQDLLVMPHWFYLLQQTKPLVIAQVVWAVMWWGMPLWMYPLWLWAASLTLGLLARKANEKAMRKGIRVWNDEIETQADVELATTHTKSGAGKKMRGMVGSVVDVAGGLVGGAAGGLDTLLNVVSIYTKFMQYIQNMLIAISSEVEKYLNLLCFADTITSSIVYIALLLLSAISSLLLFLIPWEFVGFTLGAIALCIPVLVQLGTPPPSSLEVTILEARHLDAKDSGNSSDPFVKVFAPKGVTGSAAVKLGECYRSYTVYRNLNPVWDFEKARDQQYMVQGGALNGLPHLSRDMAERWKKQKKDGTIPVERKARHNK